MGYYVRVSTRGTAKSGTPRQALNYISDGHDARRDPSFSDAELRYVARMDPGWKADLEGGRVPLVGFGQLATHADHERLTQEFEEACLPTNCKRGTIGYKSITLTLPKEVSLFAEGHREEAKGAIYAAVHSALDRSFAGLRYSAVAAIHTRNQVGEIHYHVHVLVAKFAQDINTGRTVSLNSTASRNGPARIRDLKAGWQEGIEKEFRERLRLGIEQKTPRNPVSLVLPDGERLEPLNRDSRRVLEKELCPTYTETTPEGHAVILSSARGFIDFCIKAGIIRRDPLIKVEISGHKKRGKKQLHIDESRRFIEEALKHPDDPLAVACAAMIYTGLRPGEIMGLQVRDLDAEGTILWVEKSKTEAGKRGVEVAEVFRPFLKSLAQGRGSQEFLFELKPERVRACKDERKSRRDALLRKTQALCEAAGLPVVCSHSMRGLHSTLAAGFGATGHAVAKALGHTSFSVTKRHYVDREVLENANLRSNLQVLAGPSSGNRHGN